MRKFLKVFFSLAVTIYFSTTMFYCFVAGAPQNGKGAVIYVVSAAGLSILFPWLLPVAVFITLSISGKNWINRANNQVLWYDKEKQRMDETGQLCIIIERKTVTVRKTA